MSGRMVLTTCARTVHDPRRDSTVVQSWSVNAQLRRQLRMQFDARLGILIDQRANTPRLRPGEKMADDATGREHDRILGIDIFGGRRVRRDVESRFSVGKVKWPAPFGDRIPRARLEQPRGSGMIFGRDTARRRPFRAPLFRR